MKNVFYFKSINAIGGCESWFYYLSRLYKNMVVYYKEGNVEQIKRLAKNIEVHKYKEGEIINCDNFFCCYNPDIIPFVNAKLYCHIIHCDYSYVNFKPIINPKFNKYIAVSKLAGESFKNITGIDYELIYNPIDIDMPKVEKYNDGKLHIISATRLTKEKGLMRMQKLAKLLEANNIDYIWEVYTNKVREVIGKNVVYKEPKMDIIEEIAKSDLLVQLSDCEAFCYTIVESAMVGTKVVCTNLPVLEEIGIDNSNAYICDFNMDNINILELIKTLPKKAYKPPKSEWNRYLDNNSTYNPEELIKVKAKRNIYLTIEDKHITKGTEFEISRSRASELECLDLIKE